MFGYVGLTAPPFSDAGTLLTNLFWEQSRRDDRFDCIFGTVDLMDSVTVYGLANPRLDLSYLAFSSEPGRMAKPGVRQLVRADDTLP